MKVAHVVMGGEVAGGQFVALQLIRAARARGDTAMVVTPSRGPFTDLVEPEGGAVHVLDLTRTFKLRGLAAFVRLLRHERADVVHTHGQVAMNALARVGGRLAGARVVSHMHIENHFRPNRHVRAVHAGLDNATARLCARIVCVSDDTQRAFERQGYPVARMEVVHNGIDVSAVDRSGRERVRRELGIPDGSPLIGEIARLCDVKGQRELIEAFAGLDGDARLVLVGRDVEQGGAFESALRGRAAELGVADRVLFAGYRPDPHAVLEAVDVLVLPSWIEGLPLVVLEALAHAKPVVATPVGGTPELVRDDETGLLVPPRDPEALGAAISRLVDDRELARRLGEAGHELVARSFSEDAMCRRVLEIYDEATG